ncbi:HU family DNA-binding protein [Roseovarius pacificus]|uniref:HU family DNA-binding protein n=1 Tax=Roseovarius pacificus TaxID=337701 RepID=UPI002A18BC6F|nr:HU family DNA-binding protein [Roseovarius pacificus]
MTTRRSASSKAKTSSRTSTAPKSATSGKTAAKAPAKPAAKTAPEPGVVSETTVTAVAPELKKKELIDMVTDRAGVKKKFAKPVVEAMIDILGEAIAEGRELNLQPLGKLKHQRTKETPNARITVAKIRQSKSASPALEHGADKAKESVADAAE